jgi:hypothetical protein
MYRTYNQLLSKQRLPSPDFRLLALRPLPDALRRVLRQRYGAALGFTPLSRIPPFGE